MLLTVLVLGCRSTPDRPDLQRQVDALREQNAALLKENHALARRLELLRIEDDFGITQWVPLSAPAGSTARC